VHAQPRVGRRATEFFADGARFADETAEPADVERDRAIAMRFDTRRKIARKLDES
jgi:hypothetical protein